MLEAFKASTAAEKAPQPPPPAAGTAPRAGGPFAPDPAPATGAAAAPPPRVLPWRPSQLQRLIVLQVLLLLAAFLLGRATAPSVQAAGAPQGDPRTAAEVPAAQPQAPVQEPPPPAAATTPLSAAEKALMDPANVYTVAVVQYRTQRDEALALQTRNYLESIGIPACIVVLGKQLRVVAGAAPQKRDLKVLLERVRSINGPPPLSKRSEFYDAYEVEIDRVYPRSS